MHAHLLITAHVVLCAYQWFAPGCGGGGVGGGGERQLTGNLTFSGFSMSIFPPLLSIMSQISAPGANL